MKSRIVSIASFVYCNVLSSWHFQRVHNGIESRSGQRPELTWVRSPWQNSPIIFTFYSRYQITTFLSAKIQKVFFYVYWNTLTDLFKSFFFFYCNFIIKRVEVNWQFVYVYNLNLNSTLIFSTYKNFSEVILKWKKLRT